MIDLKSLRKKTDKLLADREYALKKVVEEREALEESKEDLKAALEVQGIFQSHAEFIQTQVHSQISSVVTRCLKSVFGPTGPEFKIDFKRARGKTEARLIFTKNGEEFVPTEEDGGGVVDIAALALRLTCLRLSTPTLRRLIVADEPFKWVNGEEFQERVGDLIRNLAHEFKVQFVIVSDDAWLRQGKIVEM